MPLRPFPLPLNLGTDICHTPRFSKYLLHLRPQLPSSKTGTSSTSSTSTSTPLFHLFDKLLLPTEQVIFWKRFGPLESLAKLQRRREAATCWIAGRWAAKEAIIKAHAPTKRVLLKNIEIRTLNTGQPYGVVLDAITKTSKAEDIYANFSDRYIAFRDESESVDMDGLEASEKGGEMKEGRVYDESNTHLGAKESGTVTEDIISDPEEDINGQVVKVSISHDGEYCTAVALAHVEIAVPELGL